MLREVRARYDKGRLVIADGLEPPPDGAEVTVVYESKAPAPPEGDETYGSWAGKFPADFDIEKELAAVRSGSKRRLEDTSG